jgi:hypothetical protein
MTEPVIRQYIAPGGIGWVLALIALILCVVFYFMGGRAAPVELFLIGLVAASRLC